MKENLIMKILITAILISFTVVSCHQMNRWFGVDDDNIFEEITEDLIESKTGLDIDLTPGSPED